MRNLFLMVAALAASAATALGVGSDAHAVQVETELTYNGSGSETRVWFDETSPYITGEVDFGITDLDVIPGAIQFRLRFETTTTATVSVPTTLNVSAPDGGVVEGEEVPVVLTNTAKDGPQNEFRLQAGAQLTFYADYDVDEDGTACDGFPDTDPDDGQSDDLCLVIPIGKTIDVFNESMTAPYELAKKLFDDEKELVKVQVCQLIFGLDICSIQLVGTVNAEFEASAGSTGGAPVITAGFHSTRDLTIGSNTVAGSEKLLKFPSPAQITDSAKVACGVSPGAVLSYRLRDNSYDARLLESGAGLRIDVSFYVDTEIFGELSKTFTLVNLPNLYPFHDDPIGVFAQANDFQLALGPVQAEQQPPVITGVSASPANPAEGVPVTFVVEAEDNCTSAADLSVTWTYSDGGVSFGSQTVHAFPDNGSFTHKVTVCDLRGNCASRDGLIAVSNASPIANAGPDAIDAWGRNIPFNGQAVDPGTADQGTLSYEWDFGDNTPKGHAKDVTHAYTTPGTYTATLKVCDKDGACHTDSREITVRKRNTSTGYLGSNTWTFDTQVTLSASLVDEFGQPVNGRPIQFSIDGDVVTTANTGSSGVGSRAYQVVQTAGDHSVDAAFAGDSLYVASDSAQSAVVVVKPTSVSYTGALTGGPNKTITLSAILTDSEGKPLAGRVIVFTLGTQTAQATTNANGVASTTLKLAQKNGTYSLTATYTPTGGDTSKYGGSSSSNTFKLQAK